MDFALSIAQNDLALSERAWLSKHDPIATRRATIDDGPARIPPDARRHVAESGLVGLLTGDMGGTHVDLAVVVEEYGRAASPVPLAELALSTAALARLDRSLPGLADANATGAEVLLLTSSFAGGAPLTATVEDGGRLRVRGTSAPVPGLADATGLVVTAIAPDGVEVLAVVRPSEDGTRVRVLESLDLTRSWGAADIDVTLPLDRWSTVSAGTVAELTDALALYRKMDALGCAARLLDETVAYTGQRTQFGHPIASFQAVKHHCANMAVQVEASRATLWAAAVALDSGDAALRTHAVSSAAAYAGEATSDVASTALQVHGGIGFTWEHDLHLLLRRIKVDELLDGSVGWHRRRLVRE